jgi:hypothetical protein
MSSWELTVENKTKTIATRSGQLTDDKFRQLVSNPNGLIARVNMGVSESLEYGALKVSASVTLACDQTEEAINRAGELAFNKSVELMRDGFSIYGMEAGPTKQ